MENINFTQFCIQNGYPANGDILNHSILSPSGSMSKRSRDSELKAMRERIGQNIKAHAEYEALIFSGDIVDPSGDYTRKAIVKAINDDIQKHIDCKNTGIAYILSLGRMAHTKSGKLRKGYQRTVEDYKNQISELLTRKAVWLCLSKN